MYQAPLIKFQPPWMKNTEQSVWHAGSTPQVGFRAPWEAGREMSIPPGAFQYRWEEQVCTEYHRSSDRRTSEWARLLCQGGVLLIVWSQIPGVWDKWFRRRWWKWGEVENGQGEGRIREPIFKNGPDSEWYKRKKWNYSPPLLSAYADTF